MFIRVIFAARFYPSPRADAGIEEAQRIKAEKDAGYQHGVSTSVEFPWNDHFYPIAFLLLGCFWNRSHHIPCHSYEGAASGNWLQCHMMAGLEMAPGEIDVHTT